MVRSAKVLVTVEDPGAANYLALLPTEMAKRGLSVSLIAQGAASAFLRDRGIPHERLNGDINAKTILEQVSARLVVTGTAEDADAIGLQLISRARKLGVMTVGVVDAFPNADFRFRGRTSQPLAHAPDWIVVPDVNTSDAFRELGFPPEQVRPMGHPQFDVVRKKVELLEQEGRKTVRRRIWPHGMSGKKVVIFLSEISAGLDPMKYRRSQEYTLHGSGRFSGRTEIVVEEFLLGIETLEERPYLVLRLHPKNTMEELEPFLNSFDHISSGGCPVDLLYAADAVVGMTTTLLLESLCMGRPTLSVVPREAERQWLPTSRWRMPPIVGNRDELRVALREVILEGHGPDPEAVDRLFPRDCLMRLCDFCQDLLNQSAASFGTAPASCPGN